jgi:hypothetical protein
MQSTLLDYSVATDPFPLQATEVATVSVVASNPSPDPGDNPVQVTGIEITIPIGDGGSALTADATSIAPLAPTGWTLQPDTPAGVYAFVPPGGSIEVGADSLVFALQQVAVNDQPGYVQGFRVTERSGGEAAPQLTKFPAGWGSVDFWVDPPNITSGQSTTLNWAGPAGATYTIEYAAGGAVVNVPGPGQPPLANRGAYPGAQAPPLEPAQTTVFTLQVSLTEGVDQYTTQTQKTVTVVELPAITLFTGTLAAAGTGYELNVQWAAVNADYCMLGSDATELAPQGTRGVPLDPPGNGAFQLQAVARSAPAPATSALTVNWGTIGSATLTPGGPAGFPRVTPDGTLLFVSRLAGIDQLTIPPVPSGNLQPRWSSSWGDQPVGGLAVAAPPAPAGALWVGSWSSGGFGSTQLTLELVSFASDGTPTTLASQPVGQLNVGADSFVAASPDGASVYIWDGNSTLYGFAVAGGSSLSQAWLVEIDSYYVSGLAVGADGTLYISGTPGIYAYAPAQLPPTGSPTASVGLPWMPFDLTFGGGLLFATNGQQILCVDCASMQLAGVPIATQGNNAGAAPDGRRVFAAVDQPATIAVLAPGSVSGGVTPGGN